MVIWCNMPLQVFVSAYCKSAHLQSHNPNSNLWQTIGPRNCNGEPFWGFIFRKHIPGYKMLQFIPRVKQKLECKLPSWRKQRDGHLQQVQDAASGASEKRLDPQWLWLASTSCTSEHRLFSCFFLLLLLFFRALKGLWKIGYLNLFDAVCMENACFGGWCQYQRCGRYKGHARKMQLIGSALLYMSLHSQMQNYFCFPLPIFVCVRQDTIKKLVVPSQEKAACSANEWTWFWPSWPNSLIC